MLVRPREEYVDGPAQVGLAGSGCGGLVEGLRAEPGHLRLVRSELLGDAHFHAALVGLTGPLRVVVMHLELEPLPGYSESDVLGKGRRFVSGGPADDERGIRMSPDCRTGRTVRHGAGGVVEKPVMDDGVVVDEGAGPDDLYRLVPPRERVVERHVVVRRR